MKFIQALAAAAALLATATATVADNCTSEAFMTAFKSSPEYKAYKSLECSKLVLEGKPCGQIPCLPVLEALVPMLPDCSAYGVTLKQETQELVDSVHKNCKADGWTSPPRGNATAASKDTQLTTTTPSSSSNSTTGDLVECTDEQWRAFMGGKAYEAYDVECHSPPEVSVAAANDKLCGKACLDAWHALEENRPRCLVGGRKDYQITTSSAAEIEEQCATTHPKNGTTTPPTSTPASSPAATLVATSAVSIAVATTFFQL